jgi:aminocarboxymuconate-semialdehyde decarboxylase
MEWVEFLGSRNGPTRMEHRGSARVFFQHDKICSRIVSAGHYDPEMRIKDMDRCGIDTQIISLTVPSVEELPADQGLEWARKINDAFAETCARHPGRFYAYATLPCQDVDASLQELDRCYKSLGVKGIAMFSNVNFEPLASPKFHPIYEKAQAYGLPIFIHPAVPYTFDVMKEHKLTPPLYGFTLDTTMAVMGLVWQGVLEKYPGLRIVHAHLGGVVPYLVQRMEDCWRAAHQESGLNLLKKPSEYYQEQVYPDSMSAHVPAMKCCLDFVGAKHMVMGTDYAHRIGNWEQAVALIRSLGLPKEETDQILGGNAAGLFKID